MLVSGGCDRARIAPSPSLPAASVAQVWALVPGGFPEAVGGHLSQGQTQWCFSFRRRPRRLPARLRLKAVQGLRQQPPGPLELWQQLCEGRPGPGWVTGRGHGGGVV